MIFPKNGVIAWNEEFDDYALCPPGGVKSITSPC